MSLLHVILDRDGVLNRENNSGGWIETPDDWSWEARALDALCLLSEAGVRVSVVTNQSCIGRGLVKSDAVARIHDHMLRQAEARGAKVAAVFVCPHAPDDGCSCRKPMPGLVIDAIAESGVPPADTVLIGDAERDLEAGRLAGVQVMLVRTGKGAQTEARLGDAALAGAGIHVADDLYCATRQLLASGITSGVGLAG